MCVCARRPTYVSTGVAQIQYVLTDKTGTLTQNIMVFKKVHMVALQCADTATVARSVLFVGRRMGTRQRRLMPWSMKHSSVPSRLVIRPRLRSCAPLPSVIPSFQKHATGKSFTRCRRRCRRRRRWYVYVRYMWGFALRAGLFSGRGVAGVRCRRAWRSVRPVWPSVSRTPYRVRSRFLTREADAMTISVLGVSERYELLHSLEFSSDRKRMSVVVRMHAGVLFVVSVGAVGYV